MTAIDNVVGNVRGLTIAYVSGSAALSVVTVVREGELTEIAAYQFEARA